MEFSKEDKFLTVAWQSDHYMAFARLSLVYFGFFEDFQEHFDAEAFAAFKQMVVLWYSLLGSLFGDIKCNAEVVDNYVKLFLSACSCFGERTTTDAYKQMETKCDEPTEGTKVKGKSKKTSKKKAKKSSKKKTEQPKKMAKQPVKETKNKKKSTNSKMKETDQPEEKSKKPVRGNKNKEMFFDGTANYLSMLNFLELIQRHGSARALWEGEREKYIKFVKRQMESLQESYLKRILTKILESHCLQDLMEGNVYTDDLPQYERTYMCKIYKSYDDFKENFWNVGKMFFGVMLKSEDNANDVHVCIEDNMTGEIQLKKVCFNDDHKKGKMKMNLWYCPVTLENKANHTFPDRKGLNDRIADVVPLHPMVTLDGGYLKENGHVAITRSWRVRSKDGGMAPLCPLKCIFNKILV